MDPEPMKEARARIHQPADPIPAKLILVEQPVVPPCDGHVLAIFNGHCWHLENAAMDTAEVQDHRRKSFHPGLHARIFHLSDAPSAPLAVDAKKKLWCHKCGYSIDSSHLNTKGQHMVCGIAPSPFAPLAVDAGVREGVLAQIHRLYEPGQKSLATAEHILTYLRSQGWGPKGVTTLPCDRCGKEVSNADAYEDRICPDCAKPKPMTIKVGGFDPSGRGGTPVRTVEIEPKPETDASKRYEEQIARTNQLYFVVGGAPPPEFTKEREAAAVVHAELQGKLDAAEKRVKIEQLKSQTSLANNLCSDHRDKQNGKKCLACLIDLAERRLAIAREALTRIRDTRLLGSVEMSATVEDRLDQWCDATARCWRDADETLKRIDGEEKR